MANQGSPRVSDQTRSSSLTDLVSTGARLLPLQLKDELSMVKSQMTKKGITVGIGAGLAVVGLVFLFIMVVSLIVAMIGGFAQDRPVWFSALMVAAGALVVALILILIGVFRIKAAMPLVPAETVKGIKYDLGYLKEGNAFDPAEFDRLEAQKAEDKKVAAEREEERRKAVAAEDKAAKKRGEAPSHATVQSPSYAELARRAQLRRQHLGDIRSGLEEKTDVKSQFSAFTSQFKGGQPHSSGGTESTSPTAPYHTGARAGQKANDASGYVKEKWQPLALLGAASTAITVFARQLKK
ncbi:phage holin family protein [Citricoccus sp. GCM10030269]|uniref:phage holin family protein n=1 Tax=Citricoccus sp. GCM10030269 TaxID=3273388 RepID=UPI003607F0C4